MLNSTGTLSYVVDPAVVKAFDQSVDQLFTKVQYKKFPFKEYQIETESDAMTSATGYGLGGLTIEGQVYQSDVKYNGYKKTFVTRKYTRRIQWTEELDYFIQQRSKKGVYEIDTITKGNAQALTGNLDVDFAKTLYLSQGTTFFTGADGVSLVNANHPSTKPGLAVQTNIATAGAVSNPILNAESLKQAMIQLDRFKDDVGQLMLPGEEIILCASRQLLDTAFRLKLSEYGPDTANLGYSAIGQTISQAVGRTITILPLHHMPDAYANYWFVMNKERMADMNLLAYAWYPRMQEIMVPYIDGTKNILASTRFGWNPINWRWLVGSTGANPLA